MGDYSFNKYETLWFEINNVIDDALENEPDDVREYVIERLNDEFRFLDHLYNKFKNTPSP